MHTSSEQLKRREFLKPATQAAALALGAAGGRSLVAATESDASAATPPSLAVNDPGTRQPPLIQIGILLGTFGRGTLEARLDAVKACGLDCAQVSLDCAGLPDMPDEIPSDVPRRIRREAAARGITIAAVQGKLDYDWDLSLLRTYRFPGPLLLHGLSEAQVPGCVAFLWEKLAGFASPPSGR